MRQVLDFDPLFMTIGCTKEECFKSRFKDGEGVCFSDGGRKIIPQEGGSIAENYCFLLCFLIFLELQRDLHSGNRVVLVGNRGQLIP